MASNNSDDGWVTVSHRKPSVYTRHIKYQKRVAHNKPVSWGVVSEELRTNTMNTLLTKHLNSDVCSIIMKF